MVVRLVVVQQVGQLGGGGYDGGDGGVEGREKVDGQIMRKDKRGGGL